MINSGVANSATGVDGEADAAATAAEAGRLLGLAPEQALVLSTGVIGVRLPMQSPEGSAAAAPALAADGGDERRWRS